MLKKTKRVLTNRTSNFFCKASNLHTPNDSVKKIAFSCKFDWPFYQCTWAQFKVYPHGFMPILLFGNYSWGCKYFRVDLATVDVNDFRYSKHSCGWQCNGRRLLSQQLQPPLCNWYFDFACNNFACMYNVIPSLINDLFWDKINFNIVGCLPTTHSLSSTFWSPQFKCKFFICYRCPKLCLLACYLKTHS